MQARFNPPPGWPEPPPGWTPPPGWEPDPSWPPAPPGWSFWAAAEPQPSQGRHRASDTLTTTKSEPKVSAQLIKLPSGPATDGGTAEVAVDDDLTAVKAEIDQPPAQLAVAGERIDAAKSELVELDDAAVLQQVGIYEYHHPLENAAAYRDRLRDVQTKMKEEVQHG